MNVFEKLAKVQQTLNAPKNQYNKFGGYNYRSCEDILEGLKKPLNEVKAAVIITDDIVNIDGRFYVKATSVFIDSESGERVENVAYAREAADKKGMDESQITGSASSYARKYSLNGLFLIDDVKDADTRDNSEKKASPTVKDIENQKISKSKADALLKKALADGVNVTDICKNLGIDVITDLTEAQFRDLCSHWTERYVKDKK